jgi:hypothetical protein
MRCMLLPTKAIPHAHPALYAVSRPDDGFWKKLLAFAKISHHSELL